MLIFFITNLSKMFDRRSSISRNDIRNDCNVMIIMFFLSKNFRDTMWHCTHCQTKNVNLRYILFKCNELESNKKRFIFQTYVTFYERQKLNYQMLAFVRVLKRKHARNTVIFGSFLESPESIEFVSNCF